MKTDYILPRRPTKAQQFHLASAFHRMQNHPLNDRPAVWLYFAFCVALAVAFTFGILIATH